MILMLAFDLRMVSFRFCVTQSVCVPACLPDLLALLSQNVCSYCYFALCFFFHIFSPIRMPKHECYCCCCCYHYHCRGGGGIGGGSLFAIHNECEIYNPRTNNWMPIASMIWRRSRSGVTSLRKMLYVVGG